MKMLLRRKTQGVIKLLFLVALLQHYVVGAAYAENPPSQQETVQTRAVTGKIISTQDNQPLPGVNVIEKGTTNGTVTNVDGEYQLTVASTSTLVFSTVGYVSQEVVVGARSVINLSMDEDVKLLEDLVVLGYRTQERGTVTGSVSTVSSF